MEQAQNTMATQESTIMQSVRYAGFWIRFQAAFIDCIIVGMAASVLGALFHVSRDGAVSVQSLLAFVYFAYMESSEKQATIGKQIRGLSVTDLEGNRLSFAHAAGRHLAKIISGIVLCIGFFMIGWTKKKQGLHDIIAKTFVIRKS